MFVCLCKSVTDHQIRSAVDAGVRTFENMQASLEVSTACGACTCEVKKNMQKRIEKEVQAQEASFGYSDLDMSLVGA